MKRILLLLAIILSLLAACALIKKSYSIEDEYEIYTAVIEHAIKPTDDQIILFKTKDEEIKLSDIDDPEDRLLKKIPKKPYIDPAGWEAAIMYERWEFNESFNVPSYNIVVENEEIEAIFDECKDCDSQGWIGLYKKYPEYYRKIGFSRIAFHPYREEAIVHLTQSWGIDHAYGTVYYLKKTDGEWVIFRKVDTWIACNA